MSAGCDYLDFITCVHAHKRLRFLIVSFLVAHLRFLAVYMWLVRSDRVIVYRTLAYFQPLGVCHGVMRLVVKDV